MSLFDDVKKNLVEWYSISSEKTAEVAKVTTRRYDKFGISRDIERQFSELGSLVYNGIREQREDLLVDLSVLALVERIQGLEKELTLKNDEIDRIQQDYSDRRARTASAAAGAASGGAEESGDPAAMAETIINQPILDEGTEESAILVEPVVVDVDEAEAFEAEMEEKAEKIDPEKEG